MTVSSVLRSRTGEGGTSLCKHGGHEEAQAKMVPGGGWA